MKLMIIGASGHGGVAAEIAELSGEWKEIAFLDDAYPSIKEFCDSSVEGKIADLAGRIFDSVFVALGNNTLRSAITKQLIDNNIPVTTLIHPNATISRYATLGHGCIVCAGAVIARHAALDAGCIINTSATVDHDCILGTSVHISPGANLAGGVKVGDRSWIGIGACVRENIEITDDVVVGAGAVVIRNIVNPGTYKGNPAK